MKKKALFNILTFSTLQYDSKKSPLFVYVDRMRDVLSCCGEDEEIPLLGDTLSVLKTQDRFDRFIKETGIEKLRDWLINLFAQCQIYAGRRSLMMCLNDVQKISRGEKIFSCIMIPLVLILIMAALVFTVLGSVGVLKQKLAETISTVIGAADFILAGLFFIYEQISDHNKKKSFQLEEATRAKDEATVLEATEKTIVKINISKDDHSTHITQGPNNDRSIQVGISDGPITQNNQY